jgi:PEP-CTERM motif
MKIMPFFAVAGVLLLTPIDYARAGSITLFTGEILDLSGTATQTSPVSQPPTSFTGLITVGSMVSPTDWTATAFVLTDRGPASVGIQLDPSNSTASGTVSIAFTGSGGDPRLLTLNFTDGNNTTDTYTDADLKDPTNSRAGTFSYTVSQATPEPSSGLLLLSGLGLAALAAAWRKVLI